MGVEPLRAEDLVRGEWAEWYRLTPQERFLDPPASPDVSAPGLFL